MSIDRSGLNETLRLGIAAARGGRHAEAQQYLATVLEHAPDNVPALFWLAYVSPSPDDSVRWLDRVLTLDPNDERAKAGLRWAQGRLDAARVGMVAQATRRANRAASPTASPPSPVVDLNVVEPLSIEALEKTKPGAVSRRTGQELEPISTIVTVLIGALGVVAAVLTVLLFVPEDTFAAWWPAPAEISPQLTAVNPSVTFAENTQGESSSGVVVTNLVAAADTIVMAAPQLVVGGDQGEPVTMMPLEIAPAAVVEPSPAPVELIAPEWPVIEAPPLENLLLPYQPTHPAEKWIEVNLTTQQITAWEGTTPVFTFIGSTGLPNTPTVQGKFNIYWKLKSTTMVGPNYRLPEVPYTMYFYQGYGLHGTYWHSNFGQPMSHGCVNLETGDAKTLFEWADPPLPAGQTQVVATADNPGTLVVVHR